MLGRGVVSFEHDSCVVTMDMHQPELLLENLLLGA